MVLGEILQNDKLPIKNSVGLGVDNANTMIGCHNSVFTKLQECQPKLIMVRCICHSLALVANYAAAKLPAELDGIIKLTYSWFNRSSKRQGRYQELYSLLNCGDLPLKILKFADTRWLSCCECIVRILDQWNELKLYFSEVAMQENSHEINQLVNWYNDRRYKAYLIFILPSLQEICNVNKMFQSGNANPLRLVERLVKMYFCFLEKVMVPARFVHLNIRNIQSFNFELYLRGPEQLDLSYNFNAYISSANVSVEEKCGILIMCRSYLVELCRQMQRRLPSSVDALENLRLFEPKQVMNPVNSSNALLRQLLHSLPVDGDVEAAISEYNILKKKEWNVARESNPISFWIEVITFDSDRGETFGLYPNISKFAIAALSLPFSNASVGRVFSVMALVKSKLRNSLQLRTVDSILSVRFGLIWRKQSCLDFEPSEAMLSRFRLDMYEHKKTHDNDVLLEDENLQNEAMDLAEKTFETAREDENFHCITL